MNHYLVLGVTHDADADTIRRAFRTLARRYHPDAGKGSSAERFREIVLAYETLGDPTLREQYDQKLRGVAARRAPVVEPLGRRGVVEPIDDYRRGVSRRWVFEPPLQTDFAEMIDDVVSPWDEVFFGFVRGRGR